MNKAYKVRHFLGLLCGLIAISSDAQVGPLRITITPSNSFAVTGTTKQLSAQTGFIGNKLSAGTARPIHWSSSNSAVASIGPDGSLFAMTPGTVTIMATSGPFQTSTTMTVLPVTELSSIAVSPVSSSVAKGISQQFSAIATFVDNSTQDVTAAATWSTSDTTVATVDLGLAKTRKTGTATIQCVFNGKSDSTTLTVTPAIQQSIMIEPRNPTIPSGTSQQFTATGVWSDGSTQDLTQSANWSSSNTGAATISSIGLASTHTQGSSTISVSYNSFTDSTLLTIAPPALLSIKVSPGSADIPSGSTLQLTASGSYSDGSTHDITSIVSWASWNLSSAQVSSTGVVTGIQIGMATIVAYASGISSSAALTVSGLAFHPPLRTRYLRTDLQYDPNSLQYFPPHFTAYDAALKRFFVSNTTRNRIDVFDATSEAQIGTIIVPAPWGIDVTPDGSKLYAGTALGDVYAIDAGLMTVIRRVSFAKLGTPSFAANQASVLNDGRVALLGALTGVFLGPEPYLAIWDPSNDNLQVITLPAGPPILTTGGMSLTGDRKKVILADTNSGVLLVYDPSTGNSISKGTGVRISILLPTPDGNRIFVLSELGTGGVYDAATLSSLASFSVNGCYGAILSWDGSILYTINPIFGKGMQAFDTNTLQQKGWVASFNIADAQSAIVPGAVDETGLIVGPLGHGVGFIDGNQINPGISGTLFNLGSLVPNTGPSFGGTGVRANILTAYPPPNIQDGTVYIGESAASNVALSPTSLTASTPSTTSGGPADLLVLLSDNSLNMMPENFSYGPTIVGVSTNAVSTDGGGQGVIFGYGFGQDVSTVNVTIGGRPTTVSVPSYSHTSRVPYPLQGIVFTVPPGITGSSADVTVSTANGSAKALSALEYLSSVKSYGHPGGQLMQGLYDPYRSVMYFADLDRIQVFSPNSGTWLSPIVIPYANPASRLLAMSLSPDGNTLAVSDIGNAKIYTLNPATPSQVSQFSINIPFDQPCGLAVTNSGQVYFATFSTEVFGGTGFHKLNTSNGTVTELNLVEHLAGINDEPTRVLLNHDGTEVYVTMGGVVSRFDTQTDQGVEGIRVSPANGGWEMALSGDGTRLITDNFITDANLSAITQVTYVDRDTWIPLAVYGQKLSWDGGFMFQPHTSGIDVIDAATGLLRARVALPIQPANVYDALAIDDKDGLLFVITTNGIAQVDLRPLWAGGMTNSAGTTLPAPFSSLGTTGAFPRMPGNKKSRTPPSLVQPPMQLKYRVPPVL